MKRRLGFIQALNQFIRPILHCGAVPIPTFTTLSDIDDEDELTENPEVSLPVQDDDDIILKEHLIYRKHLHKVKSVIW